MLEGDGEVRREGALAREGFEAAGQAGEVFGLALVAAIDGAGVTVPGGEVEGEGDAVAARLGEEPMHRLLSRFFTLALEAVHRYEGTINQFLGDGFMALFGAPVAHEDHARRAALAALELRRVVGARPEPLAWPASVELRMRMGLHTGPVVVGSIGDNLRMDYTAVGDTTNLAARLQQQAEPGAILISEAVARLVRGYVTLEARPPLTVKGKDEPIMAHRLVAVGPRRSRLTEERTLSPFVGRARELGVLREALSEVQAGHGQVVSILGEPGVGKSRLLHEFHLAVSGRDLAYAEGWCQSFGQAMPYLPWQDLLRARFAISETDDGPQARAKVSAGLAHLGLDTRRHAPYLLQLLGIKDGTEALATSRRKRSRGERWRPYSRWRSPKPASVPWCSRSRISTGSTRARRKFSRRWPTA
jgi:class 3 adenylate cyclase